MYVVYTLFHTHVVFLYLPLYPPLCTHPLYIHTQIDVKTPPAFHLYYATGWDDSRVLVRQVNKHGRPLPGEVCVMCECGCDLCAYDLYAYDLYAYDLYAYDLCAYDLCAYDLCV